jgi:hypothetical protein
MWIPIVMLQSKIQEARVDASIGRLVKCCGDATLPMLTENGENKIPLLNVLLWLTGYSENFIFSV